LGEEVIESKNFLNEDSILKTQVFSESLNNNPSDSPKRKPVV